MTLTLICHVVKACLQLSRGSVIDELFAMARRIMVLSSGMEPIVIPPDITSPVELAAGLRHLPGFCWFDNCADGHGRWGGDWIAAMPAEWRTGRWPEQAPPEPNDGEFWAGTIDYDGSWEFARFTEWLHRPLGSESWLGCGDLCRWWRAQAHSPTSSAAPVWSETSASRAEFVAMVERAQEWIAAGDIYQVNLARRFRLGWDAAISGWALYRRLREISPAPHAAYLRQRTRAVLSASPETFLDRAGTELRTRPIKGTRPRGATEAEDARLRAELAASPKERAELIMITDLERNDLGRVACTGSVHVESLCALESFPQVHHQVSLVRGTLAPDTQWAAIWDAMFPGGSITGAPKKRAMEIIAALEPCPRGLYTGAIGWMHGPDQGCFSIAIRTALWQDATLEFHAGSGIVEGSEPAAEYEETLHKASGLATAFGLPWPPPDRSLDAHHSPPIMPP